MLTRIDHVMICIPDLQQGIDTYTRLGFNVAPGGMHPGQGTHNAIAFHEEDYLELLSVRDRDEYLAGHPAGGLLEFLAQGGDCATSPCRATTSWPTWRRCASAALTSAIPVKAHARRPLARSWAGRPRLWGRVTRCRFFIEHLTPLPERRQRRRPARIPTGCSVWIACTLRWWTWQPRRRFTATCSGCLCQR